MIDRTKPLPLSVLRRLPSMACEVGEEFSNVLDEIRRTLKVQSPWLAAEEAAEYLRCPLSRVRKLTMLDEIPHEHDGRRVLYHREMLDAYVAAGGAKTV